MRLADFDYDLPAARIAQTPVEPRDSARLLVDQGAAAPLHTRVSDITSFLRPGDLLVVNDTKVIPVDCVCSATPGGQLRCCCSSPKWARMDCQIAECGRRWCDQARS